MDSSKLRCNRSFGVMAGGVMCMPILVFLALAAASGETGATILYTSDTLNFLEPCGCRATGTGGLPRRAAVTEALRRQIIRLDDISPGNGR